MSSCKLDSHPISLVILDRDGVINRDYPMSVRDISDFFLIPGSAAAIARLNKAGVPVCVATNQAVVGRGDISPEDLKDIHEYMIELLLEAGAHLDKIYLCTSADSAHYHRKPNPGMLLSALKDFDVLPTEAVFIGDALRDLEAAQRAGCHRVLVHTGKGLLTKQAGLSEDLQPVHEFENLSACVSHLLTD